MKKRKGLIIALYVAVLSSLALAEEATPLPMVEVGPGLTCLKPRKWEGIDVSGQAVGCSDLGLGFALGLKTSLRVDTGLALARWGMGLRYRYSGSEEVEATRLSNGSFYVVYRRKL